mmetsp:Transcript_48025/g.126825  ORF Transcript_48025/g.126825 Transcript_48025/m.126825 type:complete len:207 (+) Transcript_48025:73-693(+)
MAARLTIKALAALAGVAAGSSPALVVATGALLAAEAAPIAAAFPLDATMAARAARQASLKAAFAAVATWTPTWTPQAQWCSFGVHGGCGEGDLFVGDDLELDTPSAANATAWKEIKGDVETKAALAAPAVSVAAADAGWGLALMGGDSLENKPIAPAQGSGSDGLKRLRPVSFTLRELDDGRTLGSQRSLSWPRFGAAPLPSPAVD